jgi:geranylgeranyl diphosphate synthase type II
VGKRIGGDILQNKKTYLVIKALELADATDKVTLLELLTQTVKEEKEEEKIATVTAIFHKLDIPKHMQSAIKKYNDIALQNLTKINVSKEQKQPLVDLLHQLMVREY